MAKSNFKHSDDNKRYYTYSYHLKKTYGSKVIKVPVDAGFTCPNIDGKISRCGCLFCMDGSGPNSSASLEKQYLEGREKLLRKWDSDKFIVYLQTHTNTYSDPETLERVYNFALSLPGVVGLTISTRPDCLEKEKLSVLERISKKTDLVVELGLQSIYKNTLERVNRGHDFMAFLDSFRALENLGIKTTVHLMNGLPGETREEMMNSVRLVSALRPFAMKLHLLYVEKGSGVEALWREGKLPYFELEEYVELLCNEIEYIHEDTVIERLTGDGREDLLLSPLWTRKKFAFLDAVDMELERRKSYQGIKLK